MNTELTVKEAIEQGYKYWGLKSLEWQTIQELNENVFIEVEAIGGEKNDVYLFDKNSDTKLIDEKYLKELISDHVIDEYCCETGADDVSSISNDLNNIDYKDVLKSINDVMNKYKYWSLTSINLIPNKS